MQIFSNFYFRCFTIFTLVTLFATPQCMAEDEEDGNSADAPISSAVKPADVPKSKFCELTKKLGVPAVSLRMAKLLNKLNSEKCFMPRPAKPSKGKAEAVSSLCKSAHSAGTLRRMKQLDLLLRKMKEQKCFDLSATPAKINKG